MNSWVVNLNPDATMFQALNRLLDDQAELLAVVDERDHLIGIVTESQLLAVVADSQRRNDPVSLHLSRQFVAIDEQAPLQTVIDQFVLHRVRCLPVLSHGACVGVIHRRDVLQFLQHESTSIFSIS